MYVTIVFSYSSMALTKAGLGLTAGTSNEDMRKRARSLM